MRLRNLLPKPSPADAPWTRPAISTNSTAAGMMMLVRANVVTNRFPDGFIDRRYILDFEAFLAEQMVNRSGTFGRKKFSPRIGPFVIFGAGHVNRARRQQCNQFVLIHRQRSHVAIIFF